MDDSAITWAGSIQKNNQQQKINQFESVEIKLNEYQWIKRINELSLSIQQDQYFFQQCQPSPLQSNQSQIDQILPFTFP